MGMVALVVWAIDGGPVLLRQRRVGKDGRVFGVAKFRTLRIDASNGKFVSERELGAYATKLGRVLRRCRLDELPQLWNVIVGEMSLVGPRPELPWIVARYAARHRRRLYAKPGLTGIWQVMSPRSKPIHEEMKFDLYYLRRASLWLDVKLLLVTLGFLAWPSMTVKRGR